MVRARAGRLLVLAALALGLSPGIAAAQVAPDFGAPPSGQYPILFNDHHVYSKPDKDKEGRVLSALVRGKTILVPLRSMFEQMGAEVSYDPASRTAIVSKPGSEIRVTVGRSEVVINGETRPLDVPPEIDGGTVLVPIRVISEAMGAYVQWVQDKHAVVVRYVPLPAPAAATPAPPPPSATPAPQESYVPPTFATPAPVATAYHDKYIVGDILLYPHVYNDFTFGTQQKPSFALRGAVEMASPVFHWMIEGNYNGWAFAAPGGPVFGFGRAGSVAYPAFNGWDNIADFEIGMRVMQPRVYFVEGYAWGWSSYGYPTTYGLGYGFEKLPDLDKSSSFIARAWYSGRMKGFYGPYTSTVGTSVPGGMLAYRVSKWMLGYEFNSTKHVFWELGVQGEHWSPSIAAPGGRNMVGEFVGLGGKF
ncbi:MAG: copper amine oxidase N-terminal domain-containing protein [Vulcanimicrobiaceae bacterium]